MGLAEVCKQLEISEPTWHRWVAQYGGMKADDAKRLKELERENARLKKIVADQLPDIDMLKGRAAPLGAAAPGPGWRPRGSGPA
jgi:putative transposase